MREYLPAIDRLIEYYSGFKWWQVPPSYWPACPLGATAHGGCSKCPWVKIEGKKCYHLSYGLDRTYKRLKRLKRWRELITAEITIEVGGLTVKVREENHAGRWELFKARLFGKTVTTDGVTVITWRGKEYLVDYKETKL